MLDQIDLDILKALQDDARLSQRDLGTQVGLSPNAVASRVSRLVRDGVITGFHAHVDHAALGRSLAASMDIWLDHRPSDERFIDFVGSDERVIEAIHVTGPVDYRLRVRVASPEDLEDLLQQLREQAGVRQTDSRLILSRINTSPSS